MTTRTKVAVASLMAISVAIVWWTASRRAEPPAGIVVITLDTTRADRLSPYGYMNISLPALERLANEGVVFDEATTVAPLTLPAHTSLFTGLLPPNHGVRSNADAPLAETETTLAETLHARGFRTGAFVGSVVLDRARGLAQGFEDYRGVPPSDAETPAARQRPANAVIDDALQWLDTIGDSRFFLWAHLYDAHRPYDPPEPYRTTYGHNLYLGEIAFVDAQVGRLIEALERRGLLNRTVVIVAGDHGESLGEHGERDHGIFVYDNVLRVPLIVRAPSLSPARIGDVVRLTDVMPTALDLLGLPPIPSDGVSLVDVMAGRRQSLDLTAYSESLYPETFGWSSLRTVRDRRFKFIEAPRPELYDLDQDPFEEQNLYEHRRATAETMATRLASLSKGRNAAKRPTSVTAELQAQLASLGYVAAGAGSQPAPGAARPDPKDCIGSYARSAAIAPQRPECGPWRSADDMFATIPRRPGGH